MSSVVHVLVFSLCLSSFSQQLKPPKLQSLTVSLQAVPHARAAVRKPESAVVKKVAQEPAQVLATKKRVEKKHIKKTPRVIKQVAKPQKKQLVSKQEWKKAQQWAIHKEWDELVDFRQQEVMETVRQHVQTFWQLPEVVHDWQVKLRVKADGLGQVVSVTVSQSSGHSMFDQSCIDAVRFASPLPISSDSVVAARFSDFDLVMKPEQVGL